MVNSSKMPNVMNSHFHGLTMTCFLDLLGFSEAVLNDWNNLDITQTPLFKLKEINRLVEETNPELVIKVNNKVINFSAFVKVISDSIVIAVPIPEPEAGLNEENIICCCIYTLTRLVLPYWRACLELGHTVRGGIDVGEMYCDNTIITGPALIKAYRLENVEGSPSMIVCGREFIELLRTCYSIMQQKPYCLDKCFVLMDDNKKVCINPDLLCQYSKSNIKPDESRVIILEIIDKLTSGQDAKIQNKYRPLRLSLSNPAEAILFSPDKVSKISV